MRPEPPCYETRRSANGSERSAAGLLERWRGATWLQLAPAAKINAEGNEKPASSTRLPSHGTTTLEKAQLQPGCNSVDEPCAALASIGTAY